VPGRLTLVQLVAFQSSSGGPVQFVSGGLVHTVSSPVRVIFAPPLAVKIIFVALTAVEAISIGITSVEVISEGLTSAGGISEHISSLEIRPVEGIFG
jgi:hypothetical protein